MQFTHRRHRLCSALTVLGIGLLAGPTAAEEIAATNSTALRPLSATIDLRPKFEAWGLKPRSQGSRPTCSVFTFTGALEFGVASAQQGGERLSVEFLNWAANQTGRGARDGGFFSDMWDGFASHGICAEKAMPYQAEFSSTNLPSLEAQAAAKTKLALELQLHWIKKWNVNTGLSNDEFSGIKQTLDAGWPVCGGFRWPKQDQWKDEVLQMCPPEEVFDGHSVLLVGYRDEANQPGGGVFIFRNTNRGGRDGFMPYAYAQAYMNDGVWIESKAGATSPRTNPR
jgi:hypothetical protein